MNGSPQTSSLSEHAKFEKKNQFRNIRPEVNFSDVFHFITEVRLSLLKKLSHYTKISFNEPRFFNNTPGLTENFTEECVQKLWLLKTYGLVKFSSIHRLNKLTVRIFLITTWVRLSPSSTDCTDITHIHRHRQRHTNKDTDTHTHTHTHTHTKTQTDR